MLSVYLNELLVRVLLLRVYEAGGRILKTKTLPELGLSHCTLKQFHLIFQELNFDLAHTCLRPHRIKLLHYHRHHQLAKLHNVGSLAWIGRHARLTRVDQQLGVVLRIDLFILAIDYFTCNR